MSEREALSVTIASVPDREELVGEIWSGNSQVAEVWNEDGVKRISLFKPQLASWEFKLDEFLEAIAKAATSS